MSLHIKPYGVGSPLTDVSRYILGMPHLCPNGLSEIWLWKELGHRHWNLIARSLGNSATGFGPAGEPPVYAAFREIDLNGGNLGIAQENEELAVHSTLTHLSETQVVSRHIVACRDQLIADVSMTSVFVRRQTEDVNASIVRVKIGDRGNVSPLIKTPPRNPERNGHFLPQFKLDECDLGSAVIETCPHADFNGAGLLYFSSIIAAVDRAEWRLFGKKRPLYVTQQRHAVFYSNIEIGDDLVVRILASSQGATCHHRALLGRSADGKLLAEVQSHRAE